MISLRRMRPEDADAVAAIEAASFSVPWTRQSFWEEASNDMAYYLIAEECGRIAGYAGIWLVADEAQVMNIAVSPACRGLGIGAMLMTGLICAAKERGAERMTLEVRPSNIHARALYESFGFTSAGVRPGYYLDNGEDAIIMWKMSL